MLTRLDHIQIAVPDAQRAAETFTEFFGAASVGDGEIAHLGASKSVLACGDTQVELLEGRSAGPVTDFIESWGGGLFGVGFHSPNFDALHARLVDAKTSLTEVDDRLYLDPPALTGVRVTVSAAPAEPRDRTGLLSDIYETTNVVDDAEAVTQYYADRFGLEESKFNPIESERYGYTGTLTLFDPPERLDRVEVTQITDPTGAMGRFHQRRGNGLYMCFAEVDDFAQLRARLENAGARIGLDEAVEGAREPDVLFVHPASLHGMLMGISQTGAAWRWSSGAGYH